MVTFKILPDATGRFNWTEAGSLNEQYGQAVSLYHSGEKTKAIARLKCMYQENPGYFYIPEFIGTYYMERDLSSLAKRYFYLALQIAEMKIPRDFRGVIPWNYIENRAYLSGLYNLGIINFAMHNYAEAAAHFSKLLEYDPWDRQGIRHIIGDLYFNAGNFDEAEFSYRQNLHYSHIRYSLGLLKFAQKKYSESVSHFCRAIIEDETPYIIHTNCSLQRSGNLQKRVDALYYSTYTAELWVKYQCGTFLKQIFESKTFQVRYHRIIEKRKQMNDTLLCSGKQREKLKREIHGLVHSITPDFAQKILNEIIDPG